MSEESDRPTPPENQSPPPVRRPTPPSGQYQVPPTGQQPPAPPPRQAPPSEQKTPIKPLFSSDQLRSVSEQSAGAAKQAQVMMQQAGIDMEIAAKVIILAVLSGILAAFLDEILGLPTNALRFTFGWMIAALNGPTYLILKGGKPDLAGVIIAAAAGLISLMFWFIIEEIIGGDYGLSFGMNLFKVWLTGIIVGLIGFGWVAGLRYLPKDVLSRFK
jgi:hypothetical protein